MTCVTNIGESKMPLHSTITWVPYSSSIYIQIRNSFECWLHIFVFNMMLYISYNLVDYWYFVPSIVLSTDTRSQATVNLSYCSQMVHNIVKQFVTRVLHNVQSLHRRFVVLYCSNGYRAQKQDCLWEGNLPPKHVKLIKSKREGTNLKVSCWTECARKFIV